MRSDPAARALSLAVPAYFHPSQKPELWRGLPGIADLLRFVILNVNSGPGPEVDPSYVRVVAALRAAGIRVLGYVDTAYGRRRPEEIARDADAYRVRYGVDGVFLDQVSSGLDQLDHYAQCVVAARTAGAHFVALNPGVHPHPGYIDIANVTVTFEGTWENYEALAVPEWVSRYSPRRFCHLVHSVPPDAFARGLDLAGERHVRSVCLTDGTGANPWDRLPTALTAELGQLRDQLRNEART